MKYRAFLRTAATLALAANLLIQAFPVSAAGYEFIKGADGKLYWYENNVKQGTLDDKQGILGDGTNRGREIFDPKTNAWYWLNSCYNGAKAVGKEVWIPYIYQDELIMNSDGMGRIANGISDEAKIKELARASITFEADMSAQVEAAIRNHTGKWVRYDENGRMLTGWVKIEGALTLYYPGQSGNVYYYDRQTGLMAKGTVIIDGTEYHFDEVTGVLLTDNFAPSDFEQRVLDLVNIERGKEGLSPLEWDGPNLGAGADVRAVEISTNFSHTRPDGRSCFTAITNPGAVGENIAAGYRSPEAVVEGWMNSPGHRANILDPDFKKLGVGYYYASGSYYGHYWVQLFSS